MRKLLYILLITCCFSTTYAQFPDSLQHDTASANADLNIIHKPLWKFWMAFEDATGAKDTVWIVFDPRASDYSFDSILGEIESPIDSNILWTRFYYGSHPYSLMAFGSFGNLGYYCFEAGIFSDNYVLPITMT